MMLYKRQKLLLYLEKVVRELFAATNLKKYDFSIDVYLVEIMKTRKLQLRLANCVSSTTPASF